MSSIVANKDKKKICRPACAHVRCARVSVCESHELAAISAENTFSSVGGVGVVLLCVHCFAHTFVVFVLVN